MRLPVFINFTHENYDYLLYNSTWITAILFKLIPKISMYQFSNLGTSSNLIGPLTRDNQHFITFIMFENLNLLRQ